jgi:hypothetical protein
MVAPPEVPRNAERAQSKDRARRIRGRGQEHSNGRSPEGPRPGELPPFRLRRFLRGTGVDLEKAG